MSIKEKLNRQDALSKYQKEFEGESIADIDKAIEELSDFIEKNSTNYDAYILRGSIYLLKNNFDGDWEAQKDFSTAVSLDPNQSKAYYMLGKKLNISKQIHSSKYLKQLKPNKTMIRLLKQVKKSRCLLLQRIIFDQPGRLPPSFRRFKLSYLPLFQDLNWQEIKLKLKILGEAYFQKGICFINLKEFSEALSVCSHAINDDPNNPVYIFKRGEIYLELKQPKKALSDFTEAINLDTENAEYREKRGDAYRDLNQLNDALNNYSDAIKLDPQNNLYFYIRGKIYKQLNQLELALADYSQAIQLQPKEKWYLKERGDFYYDSEQWNQALADYSSAIQQDPKNALIRKCRASTHQKLNHFPEALLDYQKACEVDDSYYIKKRDEFFEEVQQLPEALNIFSKAIELDPMNVGIQLYRAQICLKKNKFNEALKDYSNLINLCPENPQYLMDRAKVYKELNKLPEALVDYSQSIKLDPSQLFFQAEQDDLFKVVNKLPTASNIYRESIMLDPGNAVLREYRGKLFKTCKKLPDALKEYSEAIKLDPENAEYRRERGLINKELKNLTQALDDYSEAIKLNPDNEIYIQEQEKIQQLLEQQDTGRGNYTENFQQETNQEQVKLSQQDEFKIENAFSKGISTDLDQMVKQGTECYEQNNLSQAALLFTQVLDSDPSQQEIYLKRGQVHLELNELPQALEDFNKALELNPYHSRAYHLRGDVYYKMKNTLQAIADQSKALELDPKYESALIRRAMLFLDDKYYEKAIYDYSKYLEIDPTCVNTYLRRGNIYLEIKQYLKALEDYVKVLQLEKNNSSAYLGKGLAYFNTNSLEYAIQEFSKAISIDSKFTLAFYYRGVAFKKLNNQQQALDNFQKALELQPDNPLFLVNLCELYITKNETLKVIPLIKQIKETMVNDRTILAQQFNLSEKNIEDIEEFLEQYNQLDSVAGLENQQNEFLNPQLLEKFNEMIIHFNKKIEKQEQTNKDQEISAIQERLKFLSLEKNQSKFYYYISFCSRILTIFATCISIQQDYLQIELSIQKDYLTIQLESNQNYLKLKVSEVIKELYPLIGKITIADSVLKQMLALFDYGQEQSQRRLFFNRINDFAKLLQYKMPIKPEREWEVQMATFNILDKMIMELNELKSKIDKSQFSENIKEITQIEIKANMQLPFNPFWVLGIENSMVVINYMMQNHQLIMKEKGIQLRTIIFRSLKSVEESRESTCFCLIQ